MWRTLPDSDQWTDIVARVRVSLLTVGCGVVISPLLLLLHIVYDIHRISVWAISGPRISFHRLLVPSYRVRTRSGISLHCLLISLVIVGGRGTISVTRPRISLDCVLTAPDIFSLGWSWTGRLPPGPRVNTAPALLISLVTLKIFHQS